MCYWGAGVGLESTESGDTLHNKGKFSSVYGEFVLL
jgi:hypothetical protein